MKRMLFAAPFLLMSSCYNPPPKMKAKITKDDRVWYSCDVFVGNGYVHFIGDDGKTIVIEGDSLVEQTNFPCDR